MKLFKFLGITMMLTLCAGFTSCSDDNDDDNNSGLNTTYLEGVWRHVSEQGEDTEEGEWFSDGYDDGYAITKIGDNLWNVAGVYFYDDGTWKYDSYYDEGNFSLDGKYVIWTDDPDENETIESLTANELVIKCAWNGGYELDTYVRVQ